jgi:phosphopantothenoylcysteine synthetase/decarboxylase
VVEEAGEPGSRPPVLYAIVCGCPPAREVDRLVDLVHERGWEVCVVCTPDGLKFVDVPGLAARTGHPVRSQYKNPGDLDVLPQPAAIIVAPATVNTINKWVAGIADTLALGLVVEAVGLELPIIVMPYTNTAMAAHPIFPANIERLRSWGITVLYGDEVLKLHPPGTGESRTEPFPWHLAVEALPV